MSANTRIYQPTAPTDQYGNRFVQNDQGRYLQVTPPAPENIKNRKAYLVGAGIGSLAAAKFLVRDAQMPAENITIIESLDIAGGSFDGAGSNEDGWIARGGREMDQHFEVFWDVMKDVPAVDLPAPHTVLDEYYQICESDENINPSRIITNQGRDIIRHPKYGLTKKAQFQFVKLLFKTEEEVEGLSINDWFGKDFLESDFYLIWKTMFAFFDSQSLLEMKRYMHRFLQYLPGLNDLSAVRFSRYNQYTSFIEPLEKQLKGYGVNFMYGTTVEDLDIEHHGRTYQVTGIQVVQRGKKKNIPVTAEDIVIVTNGSITEASVYGDTKTAAPFRHTGDRSPSFDLWKRIAAKIPNGGRPEVFTGDTDTSKWESVSFNFYDGYDNPFNERLREITGNEVFSGKGVTCGIVTAKDSPWLCSLTVHRQPQFPGQAEGLCVAWAYGLYGDQPGTVTGKPMFECTGEEILREFAYHFGVKDVEKTIEHSKVRMATMPYLSSMFNVRVKGDRPWPVPEGSVNLGFSGQYVETPDECVFTTEGSSRTAQMAVYGLLGLERAITPVYPTQWDIRAMLHSASALNDGVLPGGKLIKRLFKNTYYEDIIPKGAANGFIR